MFLFRWTKAAGAPPSTESGTRFYEGPEVYFANQVINNACGTLALLHILLNCDSKIEIGEMLQGSRQVVCGLPLSLTRGVL